VVAPGPGARALSCVAAPTGEQSTRALVLSGNFAGRFDGAVVGLVRGVVGTPRGEPLVDVDVEQSFGPRLHGVVRVVGSYW
jgi:hypothetical protein